MYDSGAGFIQLGAGSNAVGATITGNEFANIIAYQYAEAGTDAIELIDNGASTTFTNNTWKNFIVHDASGDVKVEHLGDNYTSIATWQTAKAAEGDGNTVSGMRAEADPSFTTNGSDFTLRAGSDAINNGVDLGATYDDAIDPTENLSSKFGVDQTITIVEQSSAWEIGAYYFGAAYTKYVDVSCNDGGNGNSTDCDGGADDAYNEISDVNTFLNTLNAVDTATIYFNKGDTFTFTTPLLFGVSFASGADQVDITFDAYGTGNAPILNNNAGSSSQANIEAHAGETDIDSLTIQNLKLTRNDSGDSIAGIWIDDIEGDIVIDNVEIDGNGGGTAAMTEGYACIMLRDIGGDITITKSTVYNCMQTYNTPVIGPDYHGIFIRGLPPAGKSSGTVTIGGSAGNGNTIYQSNGDTIQLMGIQNSANRSTISYNYIYDFGENAIDLKASTHVDVEYNVIDRNFFGRGGSGSQNASIVFVREPQFTTDTGGSHEIRYNYFLDSNYAAWRSANHSIIAGNGTNIHHNYVENHAMGFFSNGNWLGTIHNNVIEVDQDYGVPLYWLEAGIYFGTNANMGAGAFIYNNTFYIHSPTGTYIADGVHHDAGTATYKNNIFYIDVNSSAAYPFDCDGGSVTVAYNNYHNPNNANTVTGCSLSVDANSTTTDPLIVSNFPVPEGGSPVWGDGDNSIGAAYDDAIDWNDTTWTPAASISVTTVDQDDAGPPGQATLQAEPDGEDLNPTLETNAYVQPTAGSQSWEMGAVTDKDHLYTIWRLAEGDGVGDECDPTPTWTWESKSYTDLLSHTFSGLSVSTVYCWQAVFGNVAGDGTASAIDEFTTTGSAGGVEITISIAADKKVTFTLDTIGNKKATVTIRP
jgi:hypothetical protein